MEYVTFKNYEPCDTPVASIILHLSYMSFSKETGISIGEAVEPRQPLRAVGESAHQCSNRGRQTGGPSRNQN